MNKIVDKKYCMSSFLAFRYIADENKIFKEGVEHIYTKTDEGFPVIECATAEEIDSNIRELLRNIDLSKVGILLSGGMDSAILASYMPKGTRAYTARCVAENAIDETERAKKYCEIYGLEHSIVDVTWEDYQNSIDDLMLHDGCPVFANEPQVYKLAKTIKADGIDTIIFGDNADVAFGGMDGFLSKDWTYEEWIERFTFVSPKLALRNPADIEEVYKRFKIGQNEVDFMSFIEDIFAISSTGAYTNAFKLAGLNYFDPYAFLRHKGPLDLQRIRTGESKYLIRELFKHKYPDLIVPEKIAMARATDQWLADWEGPTRKEFIPGCINGMRGEQKFLVYSLERFLDLIGDKEYE